MNDGRERKKFARIGSRDLRAECSSRLATIVTERLSALSGRNKHLWDSRQRASFAMYVLGPVRAAEQRVSEPIAALFATDPPGDRRCVPAICCTFWGGAVADDRCHAATSLCACRTTVSRSSSDACHRRYIVFQEGLCFGGSEAAALWALGKAANRRVIVSLTAATEFHPHSYRYGTVPSKEWT